MGTSTSSAGCPGRRGGHYLGKETVQNILHPISEAYERLLLDRMRGDAT